MEGELMELLHQVNEAGGTTTLTFSVKGGKTKGNLEVELESGQTPLPHPLLLQLHLTLVSTDVITALQGKRKLQPRLPVTRPSWLNHLHLLQQEVKLWILLLNLLDDHCITFLHRQMEVELSSQWGGQQGHQSPA